MKKYIGVDLGGTNVRAAMINEKGDILEMHKTSTNIKDGVDNVINTIINLIKKLDDYQSAEGIGMGVPGLLDSKNGIMILSNNLPGFENFPIAKVISEAFNKPTFIDNDVNVAGLGEAYFGAGKNLDSVYYVTVSTGIGGAFVYDGKLISGKHGCAGELCNMVVDKNRKALNGLNPGALENEASGTALTRKGKELFGDHIEHAGHVFDLARANNEKALEIIDQMAYDIALALSFVSYSCDPEIFVFGGGVTTKAKELFMDKMITYYNTLVFDVMKTVKFKEAVLDEPGIVGAAMLTKSKLK